MHSSHMSVFLFHARSDWRERLKRGESIGVEVQIDM
jgi:hypothetical protein